MIDHAPTSLNRADSAAAIARLAALGGLDLTTRWRFTLSGRNETPERALPILARVAERLGRASVIRILRRNGGVAAALFWNAEDSGAWPLSHLATSYFGASPGPSDADEAAVLSPLETVATAVRFCDRVALRLGIGRAAVGHLRDSARSGASVGGVLPVIHDGTCWIAPLAGDRVAPPGGANALAAALARDPALCAIAESGGLRVFIPPLTTVEAHSELMMAVVDAAQALEIAPLLDGPAPPLDATQRALLLSQSPDGLLLEAEPCGAPGLSEGPVAAALDEICDVGWRVESASLAVCGAPGRATTLRARPDVMARTIALWLERPGLARALGSTAALDAAPSAGLALDDALAAACVSGPDPAGARYEALRCATTFGALRLSPDGALELGALTTTGSEADLASTAMVLAATVAQAATTRSTARAPLDISTPRDAFDIPQVIWADFAGALADLAAGGAPMAGAWFSETFERRYPMIARARLGASRLTLRRAAETAAGSRRLALLIEGDADHLLIDGRPARWTRCPVTGGMLAAIRFRNDAPPHAVRIDLYEENAPDKSSAAVIHIGGDAAQISAAQPGEPAAGAPAAMTAPFAATTTTLRSL